MFVGVDHGSTAIRFASSQGDRFLIRRDTAGRMESSDIARAVVEGLGADRIELLALCYSMGDGLTRITRIEDATNRGLASLEGAGLSVGGGTRVYEAVLSAGWQAVLLPGIHQGSHVDRRMKVFSHGASPEKVGLAYRVCPGEGSAVICDCSSNTVTVGVLKGRIVGAIDAPIFAPGLLHGPLDVEAIRRVDQGLTSANSAFSHGGVLRKKGYESLEGCPPEVREDALEALALFAAMEICAMKVLLRDLGDPEPDLYLAGDPAPILAPHVSELAGQGVRPLDSFSSAEGCAHIAQDVWAGKECIMGIGVDRRVWNR